MPLLARHRAGAFASIILLIVLVLARHSASLQQPTTSDPPAPVVPSGISDEEIQKIICTQCHRLPTPDILPRSKWHHEIAKMMFLRDKKTQPRGDLSTIELSPDMAAALRYMEAHAPERLEAPKPWPAVSESPLKFTSYGLRVPDAPDIRRCRTCSSRTSTATAGST